MAAMLFTISSKQLTLVTRSLSIATQTVSWIFALDNIKPATRFIFWPFCYILQSAAWHLIPQATNCTTLPNDIRFIVNYLAEQAVVVLWSISLCYTAEKNILQWIVKGGRRTGRLRKSLKSSKDNIKEQWIGWSLLSQLRITDKKTCQWVAIIYEAVFGLSQQRLWVTERKDGHSRGYLARSRTPFSSLRIGHLSHYTMTATLTYTHM